MKYFFVSICCVVFLTIAQLQASENSLRTNWGAVLKVPVDKEDEVDRVTKNWGNWIKETHPLGTDDENNLMNLSITKGEPSNGYIYYIITGILISLFINIINFITINFYLFMNGNIHK